MLSIQLIRDNDGIVSRDWSVIQCISDANGFSIKLFEDEDNLGSLIAPWYRSHRNAGCASDPVTEDLIVEVALERAAGQSVSHRPGHA